jgi:transposase
MDSFMRQSLTSAIQSYFSIGDRHAGHCFEVTERRLPHRLQIWLLRVWHPNRKHIAAIAKVGYTGCALLLFPACKNNDRKPIPEQRKDAHMANASIARVWLSILAKRGGLSSIVPVFHLWWFRRALQAAPTR